jgi:SRSO17 transposase
MVSQELEEWADDFAAFHARFAPLFGRKEPRAQAVKYLRALLAPIERKNSWQIAEAIGDSIPDAMQRLLYRNNWNADAARDVLQQFVIEVFGAAEGIGIVDETGFIKKGRKSVGVKRQYSGTAGKIENCQIGTFLSYASPKGHVLLDRRLYLPEEWCNDLPRREQAKVPPEVTFQTKPEQAVAMLRYAWAQSVPMRWVTGDEVYGDSTVLRDVVADSGRCYVLAVRSNTPIWRARPGVEEPQPREGGRPRPTAHQAEGTPAATTVSAAVMAWPERRWQRLTVAEGEKGPLTYDWACQRVVESRDQRPGAEGWLVARRAVAKPGELAYYLSNAPAATLLLKLAQVASTRYTIEQCIEEAKGETGLDGYEVRYWHSWHRHITLSMMAHTWLASIRRKAMEKKGGPSPSWPS